MDARPVSQTYCMFMIGSTRLFNSSTEYTRNNDTIPSQHVAKGTIGRIYVQNNRDIENGRINGVANKYVSKVIIGDKTNKIIPKGGIKLASNTPIDLPFSWASISICLACSGLKW